MENSESSCTMGFIHKKAPGTHDAEGVEAIAFLAVPVTREVD